jgi:anti-sigma regulatory factor (Ser/Thr protein kinase)
VRDFVAEVLGARHATADAVLLVSELATNAVRYGEGEFLVHVDVDDDVIRVEVADSSRELPRLRPPAETAATGRGLHIVAALALSWGAETRGPGKVVWFTLGAR